MDTQQQYSRSLNLPSYTQLICQYDPQYQTLWYYLNPRPRPCFTLTLLEEILDFQQRVATYASLARDDLHYLVLASATPNVFNLGGDLDLFSRLIVQQDRDRLYKYGCLCVDAIYNNAIALGAPNLTTISLVQDSALGGGFEAALSSNVLIAEQKATMGFPEILFNLFPGMGAYNLLVRRVDPMRTERLLRTGQQYSAQTLSDMGIVDVLAPDNGGVRAVNDFIRRHARSRNGQLAIQHASQRINPLTKQGLLDVLELWVEAAMRLTSRDLRMMTRIAAAQQRLDGTDRKIVAQAQRRAEVSTLMPAEATG